MARSAFECCSECGTVRFRRERAFYFIDADGNTRDRRIVVAEAVKLLALGWSGRRIARHMRISEAFVSRIRNGDKPQTADGLPVRRKINDG